MNWADRPRTSADERDVVWAPRCRDCVWAVAVFGHFFIDLSFLREHILRLGFLRARLLQLCAPLLSLQSFYNYARGHCEAARSFFRAMHSVHLISVEQ